MVTLVEQIDIPVPFEKFLAWADNFEEEFVKWSPLHYECNLYDNSLEVGGRLRFYEVVMGLDYDVTGKIIEHERDTDHLKVSFESDKKTAIITFEGNRTEMGLHFSHTEAFGKEANFQLVRDDMILDNHYLYDILVNDRYPERRA